MRHPLSVSIAIAAALLLFASASSAFAASTIYWGNRGDNTIGYASLSGSGAGELVTNNSTPDQPIGVALDAATNTIYWANNGNDTVGYTAIDGSSGGQLSTGDAVLDGPTGVAIDAAANKIYWANNGDGTIGYANLDGSGDGGQLTVTGTTPSEVNFPVLLEPPIGAGVPSIGGGTTAGTTLTCATGSWSPDLAEAFLFRAPHAYGYRWTLNGSPVSGATSSSLLTKPGGAYACTVTAANQAGSASQTSVVHAVAAPAPPPPKVRTVAAKITRSSISAKHRTAAFRFSAKGATSFQCALIETKSLGKKKKKHGHVLTPLGKCKSPKTYKHLKPGKYTFEVRALDAAGAGRAASHKFTLS